jgi:hypothetical protein
MLQRRQYLHLVHGAKHVIGVSLFQGFCDRVRRIKYLIEFFQSPIFGLHEEKVNDEDLKNSPEYKEYIAPISNTTHRRN